MLHGFLIKRITYKETPKLMYLQFLIYTILNLYMCLMVENYYSEWYNILNYGINYRKQVIHGRIC